MPSATIYSARLLAGTCGPDGLDYAAPAGFLTVLRDVLVNTSTDALPVEVVVALTSPASLTLLQLSLGPENLPPFTQWQGRLVLNPGDQIHVASDALADICISGYNLALLS